MKTQYRSHPSSSSARLVGRFSSQLVTSLSAALFALASAVPAHAAEWLNQTFETYSLGAVPDTTSSPLLMTPVGYTTVVSGNSGKMARYAKAAAATTGSLQYALSSGLTADGTGGTTRPQGYLSFKILQNASSVGTIATTSYLNFRLGARDTNGLSSTAAAFIDLRFLQAGTSNFKTQVAGSTNTTLSISASAVNTVKIWYNGTGAAWSYPEPTSGVSTTLNANTFVVYVNNVLGVTSANGVTLPTSVTTLASPATSSSNIGKIAFLSSSANGADFSVDDIYAGDSAPVVTTPPVITSATTSTGFQGVAYSYQIAADQPGLTSFALVSGTLPAGLTLNTATGVISGTPSETGTFNLTLTTTSANGTSAAAPLAISVIVPLNIFSGSNASLNTAASWSLGASPNSSTSISSYQDVTLASSVTDLTTTSSALWAKSWNVSNGKSYTLTSVKTDGFTVYRMGTTMPVVSTFVNTVSGVNNDFVYLTGNSSLTLSPLNSVNAATPSRVELSNMGNFNIDSGSTLNVDAVILETTGSYGINKTGAGTVGLSAANTYSGSTTLTAGTVNVSGSGAPTRLAQVKANVEGGVVTSYTVTDGGAGYTAVPTVTVGKNTGEGSVVTATATATISGGAVTAVNVVAAGSGYTVAPKVQVYSNQSPLGGGAVTLASGTMNASVDTDLSRMTYYPDPTGAYYRLNGTSLTVNGPVSLNVAADKTLSAYSLSGNGNLSNLVTKTGAGTLWLRGGGSTNVNGGWRVDAGTLFISTTSSTGTGTGTVTMNGGNLRFSKGVSSSGTYTGQGQDAGLVVLQDTTITLDANPATPSASNTVAYGMNNLVDGSVTATGLTIGTKTINLVKSAAAKSSADEVGYTDPLISFLSADLSGTATLNVGALTQLSLQNASGTGGVIKTGLGKLVLTDRLVFDSALSLVATLPNTYTGATAISAGTVAVSGSQASSITIANGAFVELSVDATPTTSGGLTLVAGSKVTIVGSTPTLPSYTLFTASSGITGTPVLATEVAGYQLVKDGNSIKLNSSAAALSPFESWATAAPNSLIGNDALAGADPDKDGLNNALEFVLGGNPSANDSPSVRPVLADSTASVTLTFSRSDASELAPATTVKVQVSSDLATWSSADEITIGSTSGSGPNGSTYTVDETGSSDKVVVTIPKNGATRRFARVQVVAP